MKYLCFIFLIGSSNPIYLTYKLSGGRFGDNLLSYAHAKWLAYKKSAVLVYNPFPYSDQLNLHLIEYKNRKLIPKKAKIINSKTVKSINFSSDLFYSLPYYSEDVTEYKEMRRFKFLAEFCNVNWDDLAFKDILKQALTPIDSKLLEFELPNGFAHVALHVRLGGGFDWDMIESNNFEESRLANFFGHYLKIPPINFYIDELNKLLSSLKDQRVYVYVFTDDPDPVVLVEYIKSKLIYSENVLFDCRKSSNFHDSNVLEDFYALTKFKYLIRSQSNYSFMAARIADFDLEIYPVNYNLIDGRHFITEVAYKHKK